MPVWQEELYAHCKIRSLVDAAWRGYKATVFAFGQTGAGKTFTTLGPRFSFLAATTEELKQLDKDDGILPRVLHDAFQELPNSTCRVHYMSLFACLAKGPGCRCGYRAAKFIKKLRKICLLKKKERGKACNCDMTETKMHSLWRD